MIDLIERLRDRAKDAGGDKLLEEAAAALEAAREDAAANRAIVRELEADAERYRWMKAQHKGLWFGSDGREYPTLDAAIDQAPGKGVV